jgi:hypothetical protein
MAFGIPFDSQFDNRYIIPNKITWNNIPNTVFDNRDNIPNTVTVLGIFFSRNNIPNTETILGIYFFIPNTDLCGRNQLMTGVSTMYSLLHMMTPRRWRSL